VPVILETPHLREHWRHGFIKSRFFIDRFAGRFVDTYIAVSEANARYLIEQKGLPPRKINVIHNGCDLERFYPGRPVPKGLKQNLGFSEDDPVLMVIGRLEPQKGHRVLLQAMPQILKEHPNTRLVCVGEGALQEELQKMTEDLRLTDSTRFVGYQPNTEDWLAVPDIVVLPSFFEGLPLVAMESLAAGRPIVATAVDGTPEIVIHNETGLTVPPGDGKALAGAICSLLADPQKRRALVKAGRQWVETRFSQERQIELTRELYLTALEKKLKRGERSDLVLSPSGRRELR
jgi:glycosyltransferase involved in cell wall biosynthesis